MKASWIGASFAFNAAAIAFAERFFDLRLSKSSSAKNTMPALELGVKPLTDMPLNCTACSTPGCLQSDLADLADDFIGAVERCCRAEAAR